MDVRGATRARSARPTRTRLSCSSCFRPRSAPGRPQVMPEAHHFEPSTKRGKKKQSCSRLPITPWKLDNWLPCRPSLYEATLGGQLSRICCFDGLACRALHSMWHTTFHSSLAQILRLRRDTTVRGSQSQSSTCLDEGEGSLLQPRTKSINRLLVTGYTHQHPSLQHLVRPLPVGSSCRFRFHLAFVDGCPLVPPESEDLVPRNSSMGLRSCPATLALTWH